MDLWVVKYASRRSRMGDFSGRCILGAPSRQHPCACPSSTRGARIRERFGLSGECRPKEAVGLRERNRVGGGRGLGSGQLEIDRMTARAIGRCPGGQAAPGSPCSIHVDLDLHSIDLVVVARRQLGEPRIPVGQGVQRRREVLFDRPSPARGAGRLRAPCRTDARCAVGVASRSWFLYSPYEP